MQHDLSFASPCPASTALTAVNFAPRHTNRMAGIGSTTCNPPPLPFIATATSSLLTVPLRNLPLCYRTTKQPIGIKQLSS